MTQSFTTDTAFPDRETFTFGASFREVIKVEWAQGGPAYHQFDTIVLTARP